MKIKIYFHFISLFLYRQDSQKKKREEEIKMKNRIILIKSSKMKRLQIIGKAFIKMHKKIKNKFLKKSYFQCWWFRTIFLFSVTKIQKVFRGFHFRKSQLGQLIKKEFKKFKKNYKMCGKFRRNCRLKNIFSGLRKNVLLCQNEREIEEEKFKIKKYFHRYYRFAQIRMKISYIDYKRNLFKKEKKMKKGMFLLQYVAAKNILQKNIHLESLLYHRNFLLFHGFSRLLTKNQKELKKLKLNQNFHNNRLKIEQKNRIISSRMDFHYDNNINNNVRNKYNKNDNMIKSNNNNDINDNYNYNDSIVTIIIFTVIIIVNNTIIIIIIVINIIIITIIIINHVIIFVVFIINIIINIIVMMKIHST